MDNKKISELKIYIVITRQMTDGMWFLRKTDNGLDIKNDELYCEPGWSFWIDDDDFERIWLNNEDVDEDDEDDDVLIKSFDTFQGAYNYMRTLTGFDLPLYTDI